MACEIENKLLHEIPEEEPKIRTFYWVVQDCKGPERNTPN